MKFDHMSYAKEILIPKRTTKANMFAEYAMLCKITKNLRYEIRKHDLYIFLNNSLFWCIKETKPLEKRRNLNINSNKAPFF